MGQLSMILVLYKLKLEICTKSFQCCNKFNKQKLPSKMENELFYTYMLFKKSYYPFKMLPWTFTVTTLGQKKTTLFFKPIHKVDVIIDFILKIPF